MSISGVIPGGPGVGDDSGGGTDGPLLLGGGAGWGKASGRFEGL
jgi:hypothetical protein